MFDSILDRSRAAVLAHESFYVLPEHQFAWTAVQRLKSPATGVDRSGLLTVVVGPSGNGKSTLLRQGLRESVRKKRKQSLAILTPSDWRPLLSAPGDAGLWHEWTTFATSLDLLACDDFDRVIVDEAGSEQAARWLDQVLASQVRVVLTLSQLPGNCSRFSPRLASRLRGGLTARIAPLSMDSRRDYLTWAARDAQISLAENVRDWLADHPPGTLRGLRLAVDRLTKEFPPPTRINDLPAVQQLLESPLRPRLSIETVASCVAEEFGVPIKDLRAASRQQAYRLARQCAMLLAHEVAGFSMADIGRFFGRRAHTSVSYSCRKFQENIAATPSLRERLLKLQLRLEEESLTDCG